MTPTRTRRWTAALLALAGTLVVSCGDDTQEDPPVTDPPASQPSTEPSSPGSAGEVADLDGREFVSQSVEGHTLVEGTQIRLTFDDGRIGASAGCNQMGAAYSIDGDTLVVGEPMVMTEMGCDPALHDQDEWIAGLLTSSPTFTLDGDELTLTGEGGSITLLDREVADPDRPIEGTRWVVDGLISGDAVSSVPEGVVASITIEDGTASVEAGCNQGSAPVEIGDETLTFGPLVLTRMACPEPQMQVESHVTAVLDGEVTYTVEADRLTLTNGDKGLTLRAES